MRTESASKSVPNAMDMIKKQDGARTAILDGTSMKKLEPAKIDLIPLFA